jgi:hypothetical protein
MVREPGLDQCPGRLRRKPGFAPADEPVIRVEGNEKGLHPTHKFYRIALWLRQSRSQVKASNLDDTQDGSSTCCLDANAL